MTAPYTTLGAALPEPMAGEPIALPIRNDQGNQPPRVQVHTELGVPIYFNPASAQFSAQVGPVQGKGETSELHSADFAAVVERIRKRALVVPVQGYLVTVNHRAQEGEELVQVQPCTVIEHHARRHQPFVIRLNESRVDRRTGSSQTVERIRSASDVLLPEPAHIERVRAAQEALLAEEQRHELARRTLHQEVREAMEAIPRLTARDLKYVQDTQRQVAQPPEAVGGLTYDAVEDDDDDA